MEQDMEDKLTALREQLADNRAFLQNYLASPDEETRPAEKERIKELLDLAGEMQTLLTTLADKPDETPLEEMPKAAAADTPCEDINLEYRTHTLGTPDGEDNIEGDWAVDGESMDPVDEAAAAVEEELEDAAPKAKKKGKKHKKGKKGKKGKKEKKGRRA